MDSPTLLRYYADVLRPEDWIEVARDFVGLYVVPGLPSGYLPFHSPDECKVCACQEELTRMQQERSLPHDRKETSRYLRRGPHP